MFWNWDQILQELAINWYNWYQVRSAHVQHTTGTWHVLHVILFYLQSILEAILFLFQIKQKKDIYW